MRGRFLFFLGATTTKWHFHCAEFSSSYSWTRINIFESCFHFSIAFSFHCHNNESAYFQNDFSFINWCQPILINIWFIYSKCFFDFGEYFSGFKIELMLIRAMIKIYLVYYLVDSFWMDSPETEKKLNYNICTRN